MSNDTNKPSDDKYEYEFYVAFGVDTESDCWAGSGWSSHEAREDLFEKTDTDFVTYDVLRVRRAASREPITVTMPAPADPEVLDGTQIA